MKLKHFTFLNCIVAYLYFLIINYSTGRGVFAILTVLIFAVGILVQVISSAINKPLKSNLLYMLLNLMRFVCFLLMPYASSKNIFAAILSIFIIFWIDCYQVFFDKNITILSTTGKEISEKEKFTAELFYKSLIVFSFEIAMLIVLYHLK